MRIVFSVVILFLVASVAFCQDTPKPNKFYIETSGGYGFALVNDDLGSTNDLIGKVNRLIRADSTISIKPAQGTQGPGWQFGLNVGYMFHPNVGVEFQASYLKSNRYLLAQNITPTFQAEHGVVGQRIDIVPQLVLSFNFGEKWSVHSKSGLIIPVWGKSSSDIRVDDQEGRVVQELFGIANPEAHATVRVKASTFGRFSYGFQTRLGVGYDLLDWLSVFGELKFVALTIRSKEDRIDNLEARIFNPNSDGSDLVVTDEDLDEIDKLTVYVQELTENSNNPLVNKDADSTRPLEELSTKDNFNQLGFSFGFRFYIR